MTAPLAPAPPPGPGVYPPYPAPPVEGKGKRIGLQLGIGGGVAVLIGIVIVVIIVGIGVSATRLAEREATATLSRYRDAIEAGRYGEAYALQCESLRRLEDMYDFADDMDDFDLADYTLGDLDLNTGKVPVEATFSDKSTQHLVAQLAQEGAGRFSVCGLR